MANRLQLLIYRLSAAVPLAFVFAVVWYQDKGTILVPVLCVGIGLVIITIFAFLFIYGKRHIAPVAINVIEIAPKDSWIVGYIISYLLPFASIALIDFDVSISVIIALIILIIMPFGNSASPHPLLFLCGYHFYSIGAQNGVKEYILISKRKLRKNSDVTFVKRIFEYLLLEETR